MLFIGFVTDLLSVIVCLLFLVVSLEAMFCDCGCSCIAPDKALFPTEKY